MPDEPQFDPDRYDPSPRQRVLGWIALWKAEDQPVSWDRLEMIVEALTDG